MDALPSSSRDDPSRLFKGRINDDWQLVVAATRKNRRTAGEIQDMSSARHESATADQSGHTHGYDLTCKGSWENNTLRTLVELLAVYCLLARADRSASQSLRTLQVGRVYAQEDLWHQHILDRGGMSRGANGIPANGLPRGAFR